MTYKWFYKTPYEFDDIVLNSDGEHLTGLWFINSKDSSKHNINCEEKNYQFLKKHVIGWIFILVVKSQTLLLNTRLIMQHLLEI
jgi:hypothetical protein